MIRRYLLQFSNYPVFSLALLFQQLCDHSRHSHATRNRLSRPTLRSHLPVTGNYSNQHWRRRKLAQGAVGTETRSTLLLLIPNVRCSICIITLPDAGTWPRRLCCTTPNSRKPLNNLLLPYVADIGLDWKPGLHVPDVCRSGPFKLPSPETLGIPSIVKTSPDGTHVELVFDHALCLSSGGPCERSSLTMVSRVF